MAALADFIEAVNRTRQDEANCKAVRYRVITALHERTTPDSLGRDFPGQIAGHGVGSVQITRNMNRASRFTAAAKLLVLLEYADGSTASHVFLMAREGRVWKVNDWPKNADFNMIDIDFESS